MPILPSWRAVYPDRDRLCPEAFKRHKENDFICISANVIAVVISKVILSIVLYYLS